MTDTTTVRQSRRRKSLLVVAAAAMLLASNARADEEPGDPLENVNRGIFWFNDKLDVFLLEPVAKGWDFVVPDLAQRGIDNFFDNLRFPVVLVNNALQGKLTGTAISTGRFLVNTTLGVGGFGDPATHFGLERSKEDFGQTLGVWGVGSYPYIVLPLLGPSNPRDAVGLGVDGALRVWPFFVDAEVYYAAEGADIINARSLILGEVRTAKETALDYYVLVRNAYQQRRDTEISDSPETSEEDEEDLYYFEDE